jgi:hypothetical protein
MAFTLERPAIRYSHDSFNISIIEHPLASQLPRATESPSIQPGPMKFRSLGVRRGAPTTIQDYLYSDEPQLALHIISFSDATLVSLSWPHTMTDAMGRRALIMAWSQVLAGRSSEVPPLLGATDDPMATVGISSTPEAQRERYLLAEKQLTEFSLFLFVIRCFLDLLWMPRMMLRTIVLPPASVASLVQEAREGLKTGQAANNEQFLSESDVLLAWATRMAVSALPSTSTRSIVVGNAFEVRSRLKSFFEPKGVYIQNLIFTNTVMLSIAEIIGGGLGSVAARIRHSIAEQTTPTQILAQARILRESYDTTGYGPAFGEINSFTIFFSNWMKGKFFDIVDFSPAVINQSSTTSTDMEKQPHAPGKPVYYHSQTLVETPTSCNIFNILGKDLMGNVWITGYLPSTTWTKIDEELTKMSDSDSVRHE